MPDTTQEAVDDSAAQDNKENLCETANKMGKKLRVLVDNAGDEMGGISDFLLKEMKEKPMQSCLIALGAGAILGLLLTR